MRLVAAAQLTGHTQMQPLTGGCIQHTLPCLRRVAKDQLKERAIEHAHACVLVAC